MMMGEETFHPDTRTLVHYARALAGQTLPPQRVGGADKLAERLFVADRTASGRLAVRTFGAELIGLFGKDWRENDLCDLWPQADRIFLRTIADSVIAAGEPGVLRATGETMAGLKVGVEVLLSPLRINPTTPQRLLGLIQPLGGEAFLGAQPLILLRLGAIHPPKAPTATGVRLVVSND
jgi:hypothetical protein